MSELSVVGKITKVSDVVKGISKKTDKEWQKLEFVVQTSDKYNNIFPFTVFGEEKVENFNKYNKVGDTIKVDFNVNANEYEGRYFTNLNAWAFFKADASTVEQQPVAVEETDDLPF